MVLMVTEDKRQNYEFVGGNLALDFANTVHSLGEIDPGDDLETWADLLAWGHAAGVLKKSEAGDGDLGQFKELRAAIYELFSPSSAKRKNALETFNRHLQATMASAHLKRESGAFQLKPGRADAEGQLHFEITRAAADLLLFSPSDRIRQCAGETCTWLFLDTSRNGSRRWCEMSACGNRAKIRRFRRRQAS